MTYKMDPREEVIRKGNEFLDLIYEYDNFVNSHPILVKILSADGYDQMSTLANSLTTEQMVESLGLLIAESKMTQKIKNTEREYILMRRTIEALTESSAPMPEFGDTPRD